jgi:hypothetical protein
LLQPMPICRPNADCTAVAEAALQLTES